MKMFNRILFLVLFLFGSTWTVSVTAQEIPPTLQESSPEPSKPTAISPTLPRMNPAVLFRMRQQLTFELQQTQRTLGFIDPNDKQLIASLQAEQAELTNQLKEINAQLKIQGIPIENQEPSVNNNLTPKATDMITGTATPLPVEPNLLIQRRENQGTKPTTPNTGMELTASKETLPSNVLPLPPFQPPFQPVPGIGIIPPINNPVGTANPLPTPFDQDQAWSDSPWVPKPSKELSELKQTVDSLRKEITDLKENIKSLETQIQLLNRNILLSQPK
ncbi:MAG: hypothetical protein LBF88_03255 [Planctomycetaceae bacterium]|jgi:hypothetical protein|nr:hypothetical protein [Planctomycetaceae bacterium]